MLPATRLAALCSFSMGASALLGCSPVTVDFKGRETTPIAEPSEVAYADVLPDDHEEVGQLDIQCHDKAKAVPLESYTAGSSPSYGGGSSPSYTAGSSPNTGSPAVNAAFAGAGLALGLLSLAGSSGPPVAFCGEGAIDREVRKRVAEVGGTLVVGFSCEMDSNTTFATSRCTAGVGRRLDRPRRPPPAPGEVRTRFIAEPHNPTLAPLSPEKVQITTETPRSALLLGAVLAGCVSGCDREKVEPELRAAAAKVGAGLLSDVACQEERGGAFICRAKAWMPVERVAPAP